MPQTVYDNESAYWEERLGVDVPLNSVGYHGLSDTFVAWLYRIREQRFNHMVRPLIRPGMRVLDIGSGGGFYVGLWRDLGVESISASDLTQASLRAISKRFPHVDTVQLDIGAVSPRLPEGSFDAISCMDVVHHLMDDQAYERAMSACARLLKPGGHLIFTDNFLHGPAYRGPHHVSRSLDEIERALHGAGLNVTLRRPMFVLMNNPIDSRSSLFKMYWKLMSYACENRYFGQIAGALIYPLDLLLGRILREGPSTELCIAQRA